MQNLIKCRNKKQNNNKGIDRQPPKMRLKRQPKEEKVKIILTKIETSA